MPINMAKINYQNLPNTSTPLSAENLNTMQEIIEEGIWTPVISVLNEPDPTVTYTTQVGTYKKIGNLVFFSFRIRAKITALNGTNNYARITGLPYIATSSNGFGSISCNVGGLYSAIADNDNAVLVVDGSTIRIQSNYGSFAAKYVVTPTSYMEIGGSGFYFTN